MRARACPARVQGTVSSARSAMPCGQAFQFAPAAGLRGHLRPDAQQQVAFASASAIARWRLAQRMPKWAIHSSSERAAPEDASPRTGARNPARGCPARVERRARGARSGCGRKPRGRQAAGRRPQARKARSASAGGTPSFCRCTPMPWTRMLSLPLGASCRSTTSKLSASTTARRLVLQSTRRPTAATASSRSLAASSRSPPRPPSASARVLAAAPFATMQASPSSALVIQLQPLLQHARGGTPP